eukprot:g5332.t1
MAFRYTAREELSLHVTQLPFQAEQHEIASYFMEAGVRVKSLRLVYDTSSTATRKFRGVAFIVVESEQDVQQALKLHRTKFQSRAINVRKTVSKEKIARIAEEGRSKHLRDGDITGDMQAEHGRRGKKRPAEKQSKRARRKAKKRDKGGPVPAKDSVHNATVVEKAPFGAFVKLPGFLREGLLHESKLMDGTRLEDLKEGSKVNVKVIEVGTTDAKGRRKISLKEI